MPSIALKTLPSASAASHSRSNCALNFSFGTGRSAGFMIVAFDAIA